jgi:Na+-translocating ferredoxin:NAD+ oxidoreductase RnfC subunit
MYRYLSLVSQRDHGWKGAIHRTRGYSDDPRGSIAKSLRSWTLVPAREHHGDPLLNRVQGGERVLFGNDEATIKGQREHVHSVVDGIVDGCEHASCIDIAANPCGLVHRDASTWRAATSGACSEAVEADPLRN